MPAKKDRVNPVKAHSLFLRIDEDVRSFLDECRRESTRTRSAEAFYQLKRLAKASRAARMPATQDAEA